VCCSGFAVFLIETGLFYGLTMPVQPMKAVPPVNPAFGWADELARATMARRLAAGRASE
jgi:hypothetical protein